MREKECLGEAVYVEITKFNDVILTSKGDRIVLDPGVMQALEDYLDRAKYAATLIR